MIKKGLLVLVLIVFVTTGAFAEREIWLSFGVGGYATANFRGGFIDNTYSWDRFVRGDVYTKTRYLGGGGFVFIDFTFVELSAGVFRGVGNTTREWGREVRQDWSWDGQGNQIVTEREIRSAGYENLPNIGFDIGLLGKFPIVINNLNNQLTAFPLLGFNARFYVHRFNSLWLQFGGGVDFYVTDNVFLRGQVLYGFALASNYDRRGNGPTLKVGIGHRFRRIW